MAVGYFRPVLGGVIIAAVLLCGPAPHTGLASAPSAAVKPPPEPNIPDAALKGGLLKQHIESIREYAKYWVEQLRDTSDENVVVTAREKLLAAYGLYPSSLYQIAFCREMAALVQTALKPSGALRQAKLVNLAIAVSRMRQASIQPALEKLVAHHVAGARYFAWQGYAGIRWPILAGTRPNANTMFETFRKQAESEKSGAVLGMLYRAFQFPRTRPELVSQDVYTDAQRKCLGILSHGWAGLCESAVCGDYEMAPAISGGLEAASSLAIGLGGDKAAQTAALQMAVNMAFCAGRAYSAAKNPPDGQVNAILLSACIYDNDRKGSGPPAPVVRDVKISDWHKQAAFTPENGKKIMESYEQVLRECEGAMLAIAGQGERRMDKALAGPDPGTAVLLAVLGWSEQLRAFGVADPREPLDAATTGSSPATSETPRP